MSSTSFADYLKVSSHLGEFNSLGNLWTARISSHVPLKDVALYVTRERILDVGQIAAPLPRPAHGWV